MTDCPFEKNDIVYTKDGEKYMFDHAIGEHAHVAQLYQIQVTNYEGEPVDDLEEVSEFLTRVPLDRLSKEPWVKVIEADTAAAIAEKNSRLAELQGQIGAAMMELRGIEKQAVEAEKQSKAELAALAKKYAFVRDIQSMIGERPTYFVRSYNDGMYPQPALANYVDSVRFKKVGDAFVAIAELEDEHPNVEIFHSEAQAQSHVIKLFRERKNQNVEHEIKWLERHDFLAGFGSEAARKAIADKKAASIEQRRQNYTRAIEQAQASLAALEERTST